MQNRIPVDQLHAHASRVRLNLNDLNRVYRMLVAKEILRSAGAVLRKKRYKAIRFFRINLTLTNISLSVSNQTIAKIKISHSWISLTFKRVTVGLTRSRKILKKRRNHHHFYRSRILINWVLWINTILDMPEAIRLSHMLTHFPITSCAKWKMLSSSNCWIREIITTNQDLCPRWSSALPQP